LRRLRRLRDGGRCAPSAARGARVLHVERGRRRLTVDGRRSTVELCAVLPREFARLALVRRLGLTVVSSDIVVRGVGRGAVSRRSWVGELRREAHDSTRAVLMRGVLLRTPTSRGGGVGTLIPRAAVRGAVDQCAWPGCGSRVRATALAPYLVDDASRDPELTDEMLSSLTGC
ncbi:hypothetical protein, partial [Cellulomonas sp.]|uniref:hypothetical protein n=1 Tax=Cellulomonas sp. TaxID=40001 RepID=UPI001B0E67D8